ncbi:MAG: response regulator transcription factor, partial [Planctomycetota bacterium]|nr:response regulator transcription factor [Planctomycetota bacterium]
MAKGRILVIEDEDLLRDMILEVLGADGYETAGAGDPHEGLRLLRELTPDLVVLDLNLPAHMKGLDICREIRADSATSHIAVLVLTGNKGDEYETAMFDAGADEYIRKTDFKPQLFLRRVGAVLRRATQTSNAALQQGPLTVYPARREALIDGEPLSFTPTEFDILYKLASNPERAISRRELLDRGGEGDDAAVDRTVDVHILAIRRKLGEHAWLVSTVWGVGYRLGTG